VTPRPDTALDLILASDRLPSPSGVALRILELSRNPETSLEDFAEILSVDPALSGQVLKFANSALVAGRQPAATVRDAVVRLGLATVCRLALGFSLLANARSGPCPAFDYNRFWSHSLATAVSARRLAAHRSDDASDAAFTCGLLAGVGRLCLATVHPQDYARVIAAGMREQPRGLLAREREALGCDSVQITVALMVQWGLPEDFGAAVTAVAQRLTPEAGGLAATLRVAAALADVCCAASDARPSLVRHVLDAGRLLGFGEEPLLASCNEALREWPAMGAMLRVVTEDVPTIEELIERADRQAAPATAVTADAPADADGSPQPLQVLVVDDSPLDRRLVSSMLADTGHHIRTAAGGEEALRLALQHAPHIIVSDWMMPGMDGLEMCRTLRRSEQAGRIYVVMMTGNDGSQDLVTALENGADDFLPKPINRAVLLARLRAAERVVRLQENAERDREQVRRIAADLAVANRKLNHLVRHDALTGMPNRRHAMERLAAEWQRAVRGGTPLLCMMVDIDHFKRVNDTWGHDAGDVVLRETAAVMKAALRQSDDLCRFGGEEFLAICPGADIETAHVLGDRLRAAVARHRVSAGSFHGSVTVSVGAAGYTPGMASVDELLKLADEALYAAKDAGRDRVCIVDPVGVG
jgi:two-component system cell cycle response regulator